jgi:hypothetical protein
MLNGLQFANGVGPQQRAFLLQPDASATAIPLPNSFWIGCTAAPLLVWGMRRFRRPVVD